MLQQHEFFMRKCIKLALVAKERGDSPVGCVIVKDEEIIAEGIEGGKTYKDITYHAEIEAIRQAGNVIDANDLSGYTMYTTHEPCIMCSYVIRHKKISTIVVGRLTGDIGGWASKYPLLADTSIAKWGSPPTVITGVLQQECENL